MMPGLINLTRNSKKREQRIFSAIRWLTGSGSIYRFFILEDKHMVEKRSTEGVPGGHNPPRRVRQAWRALVSCAHQGTLPGSFFISKILKYSKTDKKYFCRFFGVRLLTCIMYLLIFMILECSGRTLLCALPVSKFG